MAFKGNEGLPDESWQLLAKEASLLADLYYALSSHESEMNVNLEGFMANHEPIRNASEASIFQRAIEFKNDQIKAMKEKTRTNRN